MDKTSLVALSAILLLSACASSGPVPIGRDTFMITKQSAGGLFVSPSSIKAEIIREGSAFCTSTGKIFQIVSSNELAAIPAARLPSAEVQFMCLTDTDPEAGRPKLTKPADLVIETRTR